MKICTIGRGFVSEHLPYENIDIRLTISSKDIESLLDLHKPDILINCIGKTGRPNIDYCENNKEITAAVNVALPILLAEACAKKNIRLIHIGSGCIYFGESPHSVWVQNINGNPTSMKVDYGWQEGDFANPESYYSKSKYACDLMLGQMPHVTTLRIRMPISSKNNHRNLINKLRGYSKIIDIPNSMTFMDDFARCVAWVIKEGHSGIFHVTNPQSITAARIMKEYQKYVTAHSFEIMSEAELDQATLAKRSNCILSTQKLYNAGFQMTNSEEALIQCMSEYIKN